MENGFQDNPDLCISACTFPQSTFVGLHRSGASFFTLDASNDLYFLSVSFWSRGCGIAVFLRNVIFFYQSESKVELTNFRCEANFNQISLKLWRPTRISK